jgi:hypothetical protein
MLISQKRKSPPGVPLHERRSDATGIDHAGRGATFFYKNMSRSPLPLWRHAILLLSLMRIEPFALELGDSAHWRGG